MNNKKYIKALLLFAGLFIILHAIIPHDHHYNGEIHLHHSHNHHSHNNTHCFLINNLTAVKFVITIASPVTDGLFDLPKISNSFLNIPKQAQYLIVKIILYQKANFIKSLPVRGSPF